MNDFTIHGCEQVLRFSKSGCWDKLSEEIKVQLSFNMGVVANGLNLSKEEGYLNLVGLREGDISMEEFYRRMKEIVESNNVPIKEENVNKSF